MKFNFVYLLEYAIFHSQELFGNTKLASFETIQRSTSFFTFHFSCRFMESPFNENQNKEAISEIAKTQAKTLDGKIGVDGKELNKNTPKIGGYSFIKDPSPCPDAMASPLMTWGMIEGTPFRLDGSDTPLPKLVIFFHSMFCQNFTYRFKNFFRTPGPSFRMNEPSKRERIALELAEKASGKDKDRKKKAMEAARRIAR